MPAPIPAASTIEPAAAPRTRRALLAGLLGGIGAWAAGAVARVSPTQAVVGSALIVGATNDSGTSQTILQNAGLGAAFTLKTTNVATGATGIFGYSSSTQTYATKGVYGRADGANSYGVYGLNTATPGTGAAIYADGGNNVGVMASSSDTAISATSGTGYGVRATVPNGIGVRGESTYSTGVSGTSNTNYGVFGSSTSGTGVIGSSSTGIGLEASGNGGAKDNAALRSNNINTSNGMAAYLTNNSSFATAHLYNAGSGQVLWLQNGGTDAAGTGGGDFIHCRNKDQSDVQFRVASDGSAYSDGTFNGGGADFAELLPAVGPIEPGDVLVIGTDGRLERSNAPHQENLAGVYSTRPGFVGGSPLAGAPADHIPLAVVGIVPVKASAENGPIRSGDLLTSSATPGHAMRANGDARLGCVIGKALAGLDAGTGRISMLVVLQ